MKFFNFDVHISVIRDLKFIFEKLGHEVTNWSISGHTWVFKEEPAKTKHLNKENWTSINLNKANMFYNEYKSMIDSHDAYIVTFSASFIYLYHTTNKPIILILATRYENPFTNDTDKWNELNEIIKILINEGRLTVIANNKADKWYFEYFLKHKPKLIPSLCLYTNSFYNPKHKRLILSTKHPRPLPRLSSKKSKPFFSCRMYLYCIDRNRHLKNGYTWREYYSYRGIIHMPYQISTMSIFEEYSACIPLFFPSKEYLTKLHSKFPEYLLSELSFFDVRKINKSDLKDDDPNNTSRSSILHRWISLADFYDKVNMPYINFFNSQNDLINQVNSCDFLQISSKMRSHNIVRFNNTFNKWNEILEKL